MRTEDKENFVPATPFTLEELEKLKARGFNLVRVNAFTQDRHMDYMEPRYFMLTPLRNLPDDINQKGIYEPIESELLKSWATNPDEGIKVFVGHSPSDQV